MTAVNIGGRVRFNSIILYLAMRSLKYQIAIKSLLILSLSCSRIESLSVFRRVHKLPIDQPSTHRHHHKQLPSKSTQPACAFLAAFFLATLSMTLPPNAFAVDGVGSWQSDLQSSLRAPTSDQPQISLPSSGTSPLGIPPTWKVQALISLQNPRYERPLASDIMVIQVFSKPPSQDGGVLLGGAKIPVARVRFPTSVSLGLENAKQQEEWRRLSSEQDLWIQAEICSDQASRFPCLSEEQSFRASGFSKLLNELSSNQIDDQASSLVIRVPASLILEKIE
jgi:hypothetical protein